MYCTCTVDFGALKRLAHRKRDVDLAIGKNGLDLSPPHANAALTCHVLFMVLVRCARASCLFAYTVDKRHYSEQTNSHVSGVYQQSTSLGRGTGTLLLRCQ